MPDQKDRDIGLIFHGTVNDVEAFDVFCQRLGISDPAIINRIKNCIAGIMEEPIDVYDAVIRHVATPSGADPSPRATAVLCREIDRLTRNIRRFGLLGGLKDLEVHYIGNVSPAFQAANPKGVYLGPLPFSEIVSYLRRSKVALYDTVNFRDAAVMRLFYSIQEGCVPAAEMNGYIAGAFSDGVDIVALNLRDPVGNTERIRSIVEDPIRAESLAANARRTCTDGHTWAHRIDPLIRAIRNETGSSKIMSELETFSFEVLGETVDLAYMPRNGFIVREIFQDQCYKPVEFIQGVTSLLDIGANIGASAVFFKLTYPNARIHAFEPGAGAYEVLARNTAPYEMITAHNYGLWFENTTATLYVGEHDYATASLADPQSGERKTDTIELKACGSQLRELGIANVDIAKIDTEGCELIILRDLLASYTMRVIYIEFHSEQDRFALEELLRRDYSLFSATIQHLHRGVLCFVNRQDIADHSDYHRHRITIDGA